MLFCVKIVSLNFYSLIIWNQDLFFISYKENLLDLKKDLSECKDLVHLKKVGMENAFDPMV